MKPEKVMVKPPISVPSHMKALIINHPISFISKLLPHAITVKAHFMRPQPATLPFLELEFNSIYLIS